MIARLAPLLLLLLVAALPCLGAERYRFDPDATRTTWVAAIDPDQLAELGATREELLAVFEQTLLALDGVEVVVLADGLRYGPPGAQLGFGCRWVVDGVLRRGEAFTDPERILMADELAALTVTIEGETLSLDGLDFAGMPGTFVRIADEG